MPYNEANFPSSAEKCSGMRNMEMIRVNRVNWQHLKCYNSKSKWLYWKSKISHCSKFIDVYFLIKKITLRHQHWVPAHSAHDTEVFHKGQNGYVGNQKDMDVFEYNVSFRSYVGMNANFGYWAGKNVSFRARFWVHCLDEKKLTKFDKIWNSIIRKH